MRLTIGAGEVPKRVLGESRNRLEVRYQNVGANPIVLGTEAGGIVASDGTVTGGDTELDAGESTVDTGSLAQGERYAYSTSGSTLLVAVTHERR